MTKYLFIQILYVYVWHVFSFLGANKQNHNLTKNVIISAKNSSVALGFPTQLPYIGAQLTALSVF